MKTIRNIIKFPPYLIFQTIIVALTPIFIIKSCFGITPSYSKDSSLSEYPYKDPETIKEWFRHLKDNLTFPYELFYGK